MRKRRAILLTGLAVHLAVILGQCAPETAGRAVLPGSRWPPGTDLLKLNHVGEFYPRPAPDGDETTPP
jgi:hypothetical protein